MILLVGLGNPGKEYEISRHNAGFFAVEAVREELGWKPFQLKKAFQSELCEGEYAGEKVILAKPQTFMNLSGEAVKKIADFYKIPLENIWICYDDIDLPLGEIRVREKGSAGTHNGMRSVVMHLGSPHFPRIRLGIGEGSVGFGKHDLKDWILTSIPKKEFSRYKTMSKEAAQAFLFSLDNGIQASMSRFNGLSK